MTMQNQKPGALIKVKCNKIEGEKLFGVAAR
jgi:hypothetical protein